MMSATPGKIVLKSSTKVSLNDRFTDIMKTRPVTTQGIRAQVASERLASEKNRRLAQQMERRPSVAAELGTGTSTLSSVRDRLGTVRGGTPRGRRIMRGGRFQTRGRGRIGTRLGGRGMSRGVSRGRPINRRGFLPRGARRGRGMTPTRGMRGSRGMRGRGRGRGGRQARGGSNTRPAPNKDNLDQQLDTYMNKTKGAMNAELDSYMAEINN